MYCKVIKRVLDIIIGLLFLPFFLIIFIIVAVLIKMEDGGPIFYNSLRLGKNGKNFKMFKFRSMKVNAPDIRNEDGSTYNAEDDPRLTRIGKLIRSCSIDELPQFINVIFGTMSIIGPRPDLPEDIYTYNSYQKKKLLVRPGITGYSQAYFRNSIMNEEKYNNDAYYVENISLIFDIKILFKTVLAILKKENVYVKEK